MKFNSKYREILIILIAISISIIAIYTKDIWFNFILEKLILNQDAISKTIDDSENKKNINKILDETVYDYSPTLQNITNNIYIICKKGYKFAVYTDNNGTQLIQLQDIDQNGRIIIQPCNEINIKLKKD